MIQPLAIPRNHAIRLPGIIEHECEVAAQMWNRANVCSPACKVAGSLGLIPLQGIINIPSRREVI
jgi:hypothetical protein